LIDRERGKRATGCGENAVDQVRHGLAHGVSLVSSAAWEFPRNCKGKL
jgi:hypothetical protein